MSGRPRAEADTLLAPVFEAAAAEGEAMPLNGAMIRDLEDGRRERSFANFVERVSLMG